MCVKRQPSLRLEAQVARTFEGGHIEQAALLGCCTLDDEARVAYALFAAFLFVSLLARKPSLQQDALLSLFFLLLLFLRRQRVLVRTHRVRTHRQVGEVYLLLCLLSRFARDFSRHLFERRSDELAFFLGRQLCRQGRLDRQADLRARGESHLDALSLHDGRARRERQRGASFVAVAAYPEKIEGLRKRPEEGTAVGSPAQLGWKDIDDVLAPRNLPRAVEREKQSTAPLARL